MSKNIESQLIVLGATSQGAPCTFTPALGCRHGLIAGATGTGKTITLQRIIEEFSRVGTPSIVADIKGDLSGLSQPAELKPKLKERLDLVKLKSYSPQAFPVQSWDPLGVRGTPLKGTLQEMGPLLFARLLVLNETQTALMQIIFQIAKSKQISLITGDDILALVQWVTENNKSLQGQYGNLPTQSLSAIHRQILVFQGSQENSLFALPSIRLDDLIKIDSKGRGIIQLIDATEIFERPLLYTSLMLYLLQEIFEQFPEVGDLPQPKLIFVFDEAHLLFKDTPKVVQDKIEQWVRLIRSKGVGIFFVTQSASDIPQPILNQLGLKVQHALRAFTPYDQKVVKATAQSFRQNPSLDVEKEILSLKIGEALYSSLDIQGSPTPVEKIWIAPPESRIGAISDEERAKLIHESPLDAFYRNKNTPLEPARNQLEKLTSSSSNAYELKDKRSSQSPQDSFLKAFFRSFGAEVGRELLRWVKKFFRPS